MIHWLRGASRRLVKMAFQMHSFYCKFEWLTLVTNADKVLTGSLMLDRLSALLSRNNFARTIGHPPHFLLELG